MRRRCYIEHFKVHFPYMVALYFKYLVFISTIEIFRKWLITHYYVGVSKYKDIFSVY